MTQNKPWYREGLNFSCTGCGKCCTGAPGYVWVDEEEVSEMAHFLNISVEKFTELYIRKVGKRFSLIEDEKTFDCVFLKGKECQLYDARPTQCRTYPWWPQNLGSREMWEETAKECEGISKQAEKVSFETIEREKLIQIGRNERD